MKKAIYLLVVFLSSFSFISCEKNAEPAKLDDICTKISDVVFKRYLIENFDYNKDGKISSEEAELVTKLEFTDDKVNSLTGIEYLPNLQELKCNYCKMSALDLSKNTKITSLECSGCDLTSLNISKCTNLKKLECYSNKLTSLDLSGNPNLVDISCHGNDIASLDFSSNKSMTSILCGMGRLQTLNVKGLNNLKSLTCNQSDITTIDLSGCTALTSLIVYENKITTLDVTPCTKLNHLCCQNNQITTLDLSCGDFPNCPSYLVPLKCNDMPTLKTVYLKTGWSLKYITYSRSTTYIPSTTQIVFK